MFFWEKEKAFLFHFHSDKPFRPASQTSDSRRGKCLTPSLGADSPDPQRSLIQTLDLTEPSSARLSHVQPLDPGLTNAPGVLRAFPQHAWAEIICVPVTLWPLLHCLPLLGWVATGKGRNAALSQGPPWE